MEKNQLNPTPLPNPIPRLATAGEELHFEGVAHSSLAARLAWLVAGFNVGFLLIMGLIFIATLAVPSFHIYRDEPSEAPLIVPNGTFQATAVAMDNTVTLPVASPTGFVDTAFTIPTMMPTLAETATPDLKATARANNAATQQAILTLTPLPSATPIPSSTPIPPTATPLPPPASYSLAGVSFFQQGWNNCGPANLAMGLSFYNWTGTQDDTAGYLKPNREDKNVTPQQMVDYVNKFTGVKAIWRMGGSLDQIRWLVGNEFVVIIESGYEPRNEGWFGHFEVVVGYDIGRKTITVYDSYLGRASTPTVVYGETQFDNQWQTFNRNYIVIYPPAREHELIAFMGADWYDQSNRTNAVKIAQEEATNQPNNEFAWFNLGTSLTAIGRYEEAIVAYERAFEIGLPYRMLWYQFGPYEAYLQTGRLDDVLTLANNTFKTTHYVEEIFYYRGRVFEIREDYASALIEYQNAISFNPNHSQTQAALRRVEAYQ